MPTDAVLVSALNLSLPTDAVLVSVLNVSLPTDAMLAFVLFVAVVVYEFDVLFPTDVVDLILSLFDVFLWKLFLLLVMFWLDNLEVLLLITELLLKSTAFCLDKLKIISKTIIMNKMDILIAIIDINL